MITKEQIKNLLDEDPNLSAKEIKFILNANSEEQSLEVEANLLLISLEKFIDKEFIDYLITNPHFINYLTTNRYNRIGLNILHKLVTYDKFSTEDLPIQTYKVGRLVDINKKNERIGSYIIETIYDSIKKVIMQALSDQDHMDQNLVIAYNRLLSALSQPQAPAVQQQLDVPKGEGREALANSLVFSLIEGMDQNSFAFLKEKINAVNINEYDKFLQILLDYQDKLSIQQTQQKNCVTQLLDLYLSDQNIAPMIVNLIDLYMEGKSATSFSNNKAAQKLYEIDPNEASSSNYQFPASSQQQPQQPRVSTSSVLVSQQRPPLTPLKLSKLSVKFDATKEANDLKLQENLRLVSSLIRNINDMELLTNLQPYAIIDTRIILNNGQEPLNLLSSSYSYKLSPQQKNDVNQLVKYVNDPTTNEHDVVSVLAKLNCYIKLKYAQKLSQVKRR